MAIHRVTRHQPQLTRRQFLVYGSIGATVFGISACTGVRPASAPAATTLNDAPPALAHPLAGAPLTIKLTARPAELPILPLSLIHISEPTSPY